MVPHDSKSDLPLCMLQAASSKRRSLVDSLEDDDEDEFFDARERLDDSVSLAKWSSMELENIDPETVPNARVASIKVLVFSLFLMNFELSVS